MHIHMQQFFSYRPKSGSRVLASEPNHHCVIGDLGTAGTICAGDIVAMSWNTATPGPNYWRQIAVETAKGIVTAVGGLAEDNQGDVTLVTTKPHAYRAAEIMTMASGQPRPDGVTTALLRAGCLSVDEKLDFVQAKVQSFDDLGGFMRSREEIIGYGRETYWIGLGICPVRLMPKEGQDADRFAIRVGYYSPSLDRWIPGWADLHRKGVPLPVRPGQHAQILHFGYARSLPGGYFEWPLEFCRNLDTEGNLVTAKESVTCGG
jgi:hypothetical protein